MRLAVPFWRQVMDLCGSQQALEQSVYTVRFEGIGRATGESAFARNHLSEPPEEHRSL